MDQTHPSRPPAARPTHGQRFWPAHSTRTSSSVKPPSNHIKQQSFIKEQPAARDPKCRSRSSGRCDRQAMVVLPRKPKSDPRPIFPIWSVAIPPSAHGDSDLGDSNDPDLGDGIHRSSPWRPTPSSHNPWQSSKSGHGTTNSKGSTRTLSKSAPMIAAIPSPNRDQSEAMGQVGSKPKSPGIILFIRTNLAWPNRSSWNSSERCWAAMHPTTIRPPATHQASDQRRPAVQPPIHHRTRTSDRPIEHAARQQLQI
ncbi:hypothetical protein ACLOJK_036642 [Asimina triloba]